MQLFSSKFGVVFVGEDLKGMEREGHIRWAWLARFGLGLCCCDKRDSFVSSSSFRGLICVSAVSFLMYYRVAFVIGGS